jgi:translation initiation factor IF-3
VNINRQIRAKEVRVIDPDGNQIGIVPTHKALATANDFGLDLVEVSPHASPPVCKIMDYGRFKYEQTKKLQEAKKEAEHFPGQGDQGSTENRRTRPERKARPYPKVH